jgi:acyl-CoA synthetase (AMP-forming)/AMP-acid ligase II
MGLPLEDTIIEVRDGNDRVLPDGEVGQIWVSSPCVMPGYYRNPDATAAVLRDGFYASGDLGYLRDGELFVLGRAKEIIILRGRNYLPHDFEQCVARHAMVDVGRVAAIAVADPMQGSEQLVLVVEPENYVDLGRLGRELQALLRAEFGFGAHAVVFVPRGAIPRTTSRKIQRLQCAEQYRAGALPLISLPECQPA